MDWAVDAWLAARGEKPHSSWPDQEARFLLVAPRALQKDYLRIAGEVTRLAGALLDIMNTDCLADVAMDAPILAPWRDQARAWLKDAGEWVAMLTDPGAANHLPAARHVDHGRLQGHFAGLTPCFVLVRSGGVRNYLNEGKTPRGFFDLYESASAGPWAFQYSGLILPLSLCWDADLARCLREFAKRLRQPRAGANVRQGWAKAPVGIPDRPHPLQAWLDGAGLGCLKISDKNTAYHWTRLLFTPEVARSVLREFDYVTRVEDSAHEPIRMVGHEPFRWTSLGDLLDEFHADIGNENPISPFRLFMVNELSAGPPIIAGERERAWLFHPPEYWSRFTHPHPHQAPEPCAVRLSQDTLYLTLGEHTADIFLSEVYEPFPKLLEWLQLLVNHELPIGIEIDGDGTEVRIIAHALEEDRLLVAVLNPWDNTERASGVVAATNLIEAFRGELLDFLHNHFDVRNGLGYLDCEETEALAYLEELLRYPFLTCQPR